MKLFFAMLLSFCLCYGTGERFFDKRVVEIALNKQYQITSIKRAGLEYCLDYEQLRRKSLSKDEQQKFVPHEYYRFDFFWFYSDNRIIVIKNYKKYIDNYLSWIKGLSEEELYKHFKKFPNVDNKFEVCLDMYDSAQYNAQAERIVEKYCKKCK